MASLEGGFSEQCFPWSTPDQVEAVPSDCLSTALMAAARAASRSCSARLVAQRRGGGGVPEPVHELLGVRAFVDETAPMAFLLRAAAKQGTAQNYLRRALAAIDKTDDSRHAHPGP
jgi:hypothetical protein